MSKFCENCGSELKNTDQTCPNCGAAVENSTAKDVKEETNTTNTNETPNNTEKKDNTKLYAIIGGIAGAVVLLIIILAMVFGSSYKKPIDNYVKAYQKTNVNAYLKTMPKFASKEYDSDDKDDLKETLENKLEDLEDAYGKNVKISYKIIHKEKIDKDDLEDFQDKLRDAYDDAKKSQTKVSSGYKLSVLVTIKGKDDSNTYTDDSVYVYKIGGTWCTSGISLKTSTK